MNKKAYMLGYMKQTADIKKVGLLEGYHNTGLNKFAVEYDDWYDYINPVRWGQSAVEGTKKLVGKGLTWAGKKFMGGVAGEGGELMKKVAPYAVGGIGLLGLTGLMGRGGGGGDMKSMMQSMNGVKTSPSGLPKLQGDASTFDSSSWKQ